MLDTNFSLSTHVTTVTLGYMAGVLAALLGHVFLVAKVLGIKRDSPRFYGELTRVIYGVICFGVLFSTVGTILGGVWANDSWGRFWGWDPKENGALMLVLAFLALIHARMGGYVKSYGIAIASIILGIIVIWAFWGVNLYNIGLHTYGFDATKKTVTMWYYGIEWAMVGVGVLTWLLLERPKQAALAARNK